MKRIAYKTIVLFLSAFFWVACDSTASKTKNEPQNLSIEYQQLNKSEWLLGKWVSETEEGIATEIWTQKNDSTFFCTSNFVISETTVFSETILLEERKGKLWYKTTVKDQNEGKEIVFTENFVIEKAMAFENRGHDFPQDISYELINQDSLVAEISGIVEGKYQSKKIFMAKKK